MKKIFRNITVLFIAVLSFACENESIFNSDNDSDISLVPIYKATVKSATSGKGYNIIETPTTINLYQNETLLFHYIGQRVIKVESKYSIEDFVAADSNPAILGKFKFDYEFDADEVITETATSKTTTTENTMVTFEADNTDANGDALDAVDGTLTITNTIIDTIIRPKLDNEVTTAALQTQAANNDRGEIFTEIIVNNAIQQTTVIITTLKTGECPVTITESEVYN